MRIAFALSGFHKVDRGAEVALLAVAEALSARGHAVTVFGSGPVRSGTQYSYCYVPARSRESFENFPKFPPFRGDVMWEDATFAWALRREYRAADYDAAITCAFPFTHFALRGGVRSHRPLQIFVTQNGDWPAYANNSEYRFFRCDGLVCTNPDYLERNKQHWPSALIPNGINLDRFMPGTGTRARFGLPQDKPIILMVSALIESKRVIDGIRAVAQMTDAHLVVAGDGAMRDEVDALAAQLLPGRFHRMTLSAEDMPDLYRSADIFMHLSLLESFGNVFVEAMACGLPVVGHDSTRLRWIVGDQQFLCDTTDQTALCAQMSHALRLGRGTVDPRVRNFAWPEIAEKYDDFLTQLRTG